jgi:hypothetical protein
VVISGREWRGMEDGPHEYDSADEEACDQYWVQHLKTSFIRIGIEVDCAERYARDIYSEGFHSFECFADFLSQSWRKTRKLRDDLKINNIDMHKILITVRSQNPSKFAINYRWEKLDNCRCYYCVN